MAAAKTNAPEIDFGKLEAALSFFYGPIPASSPAMATHPTSYSEELLAPRFLCVYLRRMYSRTQDPFHYRSDTQALRQKRSETPQQLELRVRQAVALALTSLL